MNISDSLKEDFSEYVVKSGKKLRRGYTTGSCAAAAAQAAAQMLCTGRVVNQVELLLPGGTSLILDIKEPMLSGETASCCVVKDAGDDPDVTHGLKIYVQVKKIPQGLIIDGGPGVGRVTGPGLPCKIGEAAINPGPKKMIAQALAGVAKLFGYPRGFAVEISVPRGEEMARKTFNQRLGIMGGISILGTTGIVEPMSEASLIDTVKLELAIKRKQGQDYVLVTPGNYGLEFAQTRLGLDLHQGVKCANFIGEAVDYASYLGFKKLLLVGHVGKLAKVAAGIMHTHSKMADGRQEIFAAHSALAGASPKVVAGIMAATTTDEIHTILQAAGINQQVYRSVQEKIIFHLNYRVRGQMSVEAVVFSHLHGLLMLTDGAMDLIADIKKP